MDTSSLNAVLRHFNMMYGRANAVKYPSLTERYMMLVQVMGKLQKAVRKDDAALAVRVLPQIFAWTSGCANHFPEIDLDTTMAKKFPDVCGYCGHNPCRCSLESRPPHQGNVFSCTTRSVAGWQVHLQDLYGANNAERGLDKILARLSEEITELGAHLAGMEQINVSPEQAIEKALEEFADVISWIFSLAVFYNVQLETLLVELYGRNCPNCHGRRCNCPKFRQDGNGLTSLPVTRVS